MGMYAGVSVVVYVPFNHRILHVYFQLHVNLKQSQGDELSCMKKSLSIFIIYLFNAKMSCREQNEKFHPFDLHTTWHIIKRFQDVCLGFLQCLPSELEEYITTTITPHFTLKTTQVIAWSWLYIVIIDRWIWRSGTVNVILFNAKWIWDGYVRWCTRQDDVYWTGQ